MPKFFGLKPKSKTTKISEEFENRMVIRRNNLRLIGKVYADITDTEWAVAVAYNQVPEPGIHGTENSLEIRYSYEPESTPIVHRLETEKGSKQDYPIETFESPDAFIVWALDQERTLMQNPA